MLGRFVSVDERVVFALESKRGTVRQTLSPLIFFDECGAIRDLPFRRRIGVLKTGKEKRRAGSECL